jgi:hypothetical protein
MDDRVIAKGWLYFVGCLFGIGVVGITIFAFVTQPIPSLIIAGAVILIVLTLWAMDTVLGGPRSNA